MRPTFVLSALLALGCWNTAAFSQADLTPSHADLKGAAPKSNLSSLRSGSYDEASKTDVRALKGSSRSDLATLKSAQKDQQSGAQQIANRSELATQKPSANSPDRDAKVSSLKGVSALSKTGAAGPNKLESPKQRDLVNKLR